MVNPVSTGRAIEDLRYRHHWVDSLPADPLTTVVPRQVYEAAYSRVDPTPVADPSLLLLVPEVAALLDLDTEPTQSLVQVLAGNHVLPGMKPYASVYGGHQFGNWAGQLGDGRAITLGEVENTRGERWEMQLKGAGPTPYSRRADGRAVLRSSLRELICSEAMHHLGVPTTRALSLVLTGEPVLRDMLYDGNAAYEPGAVVCRVAPSFVRFGNFEIFASRHDTTTLRSLLEAVVAQHYPQHLHDGVVDIPGFFEEVARRTARMVSEWMRVGFVHGVMNTDNMSILGLTIDYGPYGWIDAFDPGWTPNTTDAGQRRYRFGQQPRIAHWNIAQLGNALLPLLADQEESAALASLERGLDAYADELRSWQARHHAAKLGLSVREEHAVADESLMADLYALLQRTETDMTLFFRRLAEVPAWGVAPSAEAAFEALRDAYYAPDEATPELVDALGQWLARYHERARAEEVDDATRRQRMNAVNPLYVPRNYLVQKVIDEVEAGRPAALAELLEVLRHPYDERPGLEAFAEKRPEWARHRVGCSMLSCSS